MAWIVGGTFRMGSNDFYPEEAPVNLATVRGFWMDRRPVTNARFRRFVEATGYVTVAERRMDPAGLRGGRLPALRGFSRPTSRWSCATGEAWIPGACWRRPRGPGTPTAGLERHPVVHVAWEDVAAYARWASMQVPTEAEWEFAARGGLDGRAYAWGDELSPGGRTLGNVWQSDFPAGSPAAAGWTRTTPVGTYPPNGYGVYDMIGNVWEWTADRWREHRTLPDPCAAPAPSACAGEASTAGGTPDGGVPCRVLKGGSYLCASAGCAHYRPAARVPQREDVAAGHVGFRCILRVPAEAGEDGPAQPPR